MNNGIFVTRPSLPEFNEYVDEIREIWDSKLLTNFGPKYNEFVEKLESKFGYKYINLHCNGHMALQNILQCVEPGEIITTPFTFVSTSLAIKNTGHKIVFCDIEKATYTIDVDRIEELINENTRAIVAVHVFGSPCDIDRLKEIGDKYNIRIIYDAAHAFGCKYKGKQIGNFGDASMFSFHATKVFNTIEGGMAVFNTKDMMDSVQRLSNFGLDKDGISLGQGVNSKMNEFQAAMGIVNLRHFEDNVKEREKCVELYDAHFQNDERVKVLQRDRENEYNYSYYPIVLENTEISVERILGLLSNEGIYGRRYFYPPINEMPEFTTEQETPVAKWVSNRVLCLPLYVGLDELEINHIASIVKRGLDDEL